MPADTSKEKHIYPANDTQLLSRLVSINPQAIHIPRSDEVFVPRERFPSKSGSFFFSRSFDELITKDASAEICHPADIQVLDVDALRVGYDSLRSCLDMDDDLGLYHLRWLLDSQHDGDVAAFSQESRNIIPFEDKVIVVRLNARKRKELLIEAQTNLSFRLQVEDRILHKRPAH